MAAHMTQEQRRTRLGDAIWDVDQADQTELLNIIWSIAFEPLDLVIDDRSLEYRCTKASFEALFPLLRKGGCTESKTGAEACSPIPAQIDRSRCLWDSWQLSWAVAPALHAGCGWTRDSS